MSNRNGSSLGLGLFGNSLGLSLPKNGLRARRVSSIEARFIMEVKTDESGTSNDNQFTLPWNGTYNVEWGDGVTETSVTGTKTHTYASAGTYDISVTATSGSVSFKNGGDEDKIKDIKNWGTCVWTSMNSMLSNCVNFGAISATDIPDLSAVASMGQMFDGARFESINFVGWDVSNVQDFYQLFRRANRFTSFSPVFDISGWDTSSLTTLFYTFSAYGQYGTGNAYIGGVNNWNVSNVTNFTNFLDSVTNLNIPNLSFESWDVRNMTSNFRTSQDLTQVNYDLTLIAWAARTGYNTGKTVNFNNSVYTLGGAAEAARNTLINTFGWTIIDGGGI
jgi:hypothetical protein